MKVKDLISELQKQDPEREVLIQQGEEFSYMAVYTVRVEMEGIKREKRVVIEYQ